MGTGRGLQPPGHPPRGTARHCGFWGFPGFGPTGQFSQFKITLNRKTNLSFRGPPPWSETSCRIGLVESWPDLCCLAPTG